MPFIEWNNTLSIGIESIDDQHKNLINVINDFYADLKKESTEERLLSIIEKLKDYTVYHFQTEEDLFKEYNFDGYDEHKKEHDDFITTVEDYYERYKNGKLIISLEVTNFIKLWIFKHIMGTDKKYSKFMIDKGVK